MRLVYGKIISLLCSFVLLDFDFNALSDEVMIYTQLRSSITYQSVIYKMKFSRDYSKKTRRTHQFLEVQKDQVLRLDLVVQQAHHLQYSVLISV